MKKWYLVLVALSFISVSFAQNFSWMPLNTGISGGNLYDIVFYNDSFGFAIGNNGTSNYIMLTEDGGDTWVNKTSAITTEMVRACDFIDENTWYVIGSNGALYKTINKGDTWTKINLGTNVNLIDISSPNKDAVYICTAGGRYITYDGTGWKTVTVNIQDNFINVDFASKTEGFITASNGRIWKTVDGGNVWDTIKRTLEPLLGSHFMSENVGYIVGPQRFVKRTINGGANWSDTNAFPKGFGNMDLHAAFFLNHNFGFVGGTGGIILRTANGGTSWIQENSKTTNKINKFSIPSPATGFAVTDGAQILKRYDASAIQEENEIQISVYPNPAQNKIFFTFSDIQLKDYTISIIDFSGKVQLHAAYSSQSSDYLDISLLNSGMYLLVFSSDESKFYHKLIVN